MQLQRLDNPQHLAAAATRLGMVVPANPAFVSLVTGKVTGDPEMSTIGDRMRIRQPAARKPAGLELPAKIVHVSAAQAAQQQKKSAGHGAASTTEARRTGKKGHTD